MLARRGALLACCLALAACGDDGANGGGGGGGGGGAGDLAEKPATEVVAAATKALRGLRSYHVEGTQTDADGPARLEGDVTAGGPSRVSFEQAGQRLEMLSLGPEEAYLKADDTFWREQGGAGGREAAARFADKWVKVPGLESIGLSAALDELQPDTLAYCLPRQTGTVTKKGTGEVDGTPAVILHDDGRTPGGAPGEIYIATEGPALPLRVVQTGKSRPGRGDPRCDGEDASTTTKSDIRLSAFDEPVKLTRPKGALDLEELAKQQEQGGEELN